jgi:hypothetical protein
MQTFVANAQDADGTTIVAPGHFTVPLTDSSTQSYIARITAPGTTATYDGSAVGPATVAIDPAIGSGAAASVGSFVVASNAPTIVINPSSIMVRGDRSVAQVTVSETGFHGTFTADASACTGPGTPASAR